MGISVGSVLLAFTVLILLTLHSATQELSLPAPPAGALSRAEPRPQPHAPDTSANGNGTSIDGNGQSIPSSPNDTEDREPAIV
jgi:hypothetical protein